MLALLVLAALGTIDAARAGVMLTDAAVFSANNVGENWNGLIWNTQGPPDNRWNLYFSTSSDPQNPVFLNSQDGPTTNIDIDLSPGTHSYMIYGESVSTPIDPLQHFVLSLYFDGNQAAPDISGLYGPDCTTVCAVSHSNGLDLFGVSGLGGNLAAQESGTLVFASGGYAVELTGFTWNLAPDVDRVWPYWDDTAPYNNGSGTPDFVGELELRVSPIPEPATFALFGLGLVVLGFAARRHGPGNVSRLPRRGAVSTGSA